MQALVTGIKIRRQIYSPLGFTQPEPMTTTAPRIPPFHLAFPVRDLAEARAFYGGLLGCPEGRSSPDWIDFNFFGHQTPLQLTDMPVAVLFMLAIASIGIYGIVLGGWSSGSTYSLLGGLRSSAQMISYEVAMGLALVAVFLYAGSMSTSEIVAAQDPEAFSELHARQLGASNRPTEPNDAGTSDESAAGDLNGSH